MNSEIYHIIEQLRTIEGISMNDVTVTSVHLNVAMLFVNS